MADYKQQFNVQSQSGRKLHFYIVSERHDGAWECSCMNWTRTVPRADCKHILKKKLELQVGFKPQPPAPGLTLNTPTGRKFR